MVAAKKMQEGLSKRASGTLSKPVFTMTVGELEMALLKEFPASDAEDWDRNGLLVGDPAWSLGKVALALDPTVDAVNEAAEYGAQALITHHPAYLNPPDSLRPAASQAIDSGGVVWAAIAHKVALMAFHTPLDVSPRAARVLPHMLNLSYRGQLLVPLRGTKRKGYGQICTVREADAPFTLERLAARCVSVFARLPRVWGDFSRELSCVATCTGSAGDVAQECLRAHVDCLVCGEIKYHQALELSRAGLCIIDLGHDTSELPLVAVLADAVRRSGVPQERVIILDQKGNWSYPEARRM